MNFYVYTYMAVKILRAGWEETGEEEAQPARRRSRPVQSLGQAHRLVRLVDVVLVIGDVYRARFATGFVGGDRLWHISPLYKYIRTFIQTLGALHIYLKTEIYKLDVAWWTKILTNWIINFLL